MEFYGYKKCSTCRNAHQHLSKAGIDTPFIDFVQAPPSREALQSWIAKRGEGILPFVNVKGTRYKELGLGDKNLSEGEWLELLTQDGKLLKRPVLVAGEDVAVGYKPAEYDELLAKHKG